MRGTTTASVSGGSFSVSNGSLTCGGDDNALDTSPTISIPVLCSDGRKGIITATRDNSGMSGGGHFTLNDGTLATSCSDPPRGSFRTAPSGDVRGLFSTSGSPPNADDHVLAYRGPAKGYSAADS